MIQYIKFGRNPSFGSRDRVQTSFLWSKFDIQSVGMILKWGQDHQNLIISFPCLSGVSVQVWSKFTNWFRRQSADKPQFTVFKVWCPWKLDQGHQNLINSFNYPNDTIHKVWPESIICSRDKVQTSFFGQNLTSKCWCDLESEIKITKI